MTVTATVYYQEETGEGTARAVDQGLSIGREDIAEVVAAPEPISAESGILPEIKGLDALKQGLVVEDVEKTFEDMNRIIGNMENQLERVLALNAVIENDLTFSKEIIARLTNEKKEVGQKLAALEAEIPSKREMLIEIDQLIEERTEVQNQIHELHAKYKQMQDTLSDYRKQMEKMKAEKNDAVAEVNFLESRLVIARQQNNAQQQQLGQLKQEKISYQEKIIALQEECQRGLEQKYNLVRELKDAKGNVAELNAALTEANLKAKKSFYENVDSLRKG